MTIRQLRKSLSSAYLGFYMRPRFVFDQLREKNFIVIRSMFTSAFRYFLR